MALRPRGPAGRVAVVFAALALGACRGERAAQAQQTPVSSTPAANAPRAIDATRRTAIVDASAKVAPAVVSVRVTLPAPRPTPWDEMFGQTPGTPESFGTGFILRSDGIVITNQHVVANGLQITVTLADGTDIDGRLLGEDPLTDIAVIKVDRTNLPVVTVGRSSDLLIGEWAIAVGNPYSYMLGNSEPSVTVGVISATHRNILPSGDLTGEYLDMMQTDAAINPGNSGGPLVNALGEVIGVNSSIFSGTGESVGLGFAIPIERAVRVADEIIKTGSVRRAWVGLDVAGSGQTIAHRQSAGIVVSQVAEDGPAARAGIHAGDVLLQANGRTLRNYLDWEAVKLDLHVGDVVDVTVGANGQSTAHRIVTGDLPTVTAHAEKVAGLELVTLTPAIRAQLGAKVDSGVAISKIPPDVARQSGLREGDVIWALGRNRVNSVEQFRAALDQIRSGTQFQIAIDRKGDAFYPWVVK